MKGSWAEVDGLLGDMNDESLIRTRLGGSLERTPDAIGRVLPIPVEKRKTASISDAAMPPSSERYAGQFSFGHQFPVDRFRPDVNMSLRAEVRATQGLGDK
jgi:hypothetical protein